jgi:hypothetical protein
MAKINCSGCGIVVSGRESYSSSSGKLCKVYHEAVLNDFLMRKSKNWDHLRPTVG